MTVKIAVKVGGSAVLVAVGKGVLDCVTVGGSGVADLVSVALGGMAVSVAVGKAVLDCVTVGGMDVSITIGKGVRDLVAVLLGVIVRVRVGLAGIGVRVLEGVTVLVLVLVSVGDTAVFVSVLAAVTEGRSVSDGVRVADGALVFACATLKLLDSTVASCVLNCVARAVTGTTVTGERVAI